jgi:hypothetical protein
MAGGVGWKMIIPAEERKDASVELVAGDNLDDFLIKRRGFKLG